VVFTRDEAPVAVRRPVTVYPVNLRTTLQLLLRGPTRDERDSGLHSWFSDATANALRSVDVDATGHATIDFQDLPHLIPNASSSAGSTMLLHELNGTVFQFPEIQSVEYRLDGSCDAFWEWLQYGCQIVTRPVTASSSSSS
jgi:spore germination protein GerM